MKSILVVAAIAVSGVSNVSPAADTPRQKAVAERGMEVMPFDLEATTHVFTKTKTGGIQTVIAKNANDAMQIRLTREHLKTIAAQFAAGNFSGPTHIHGATMPGLAELKAAQPSDVRIKYQEVPLGAKIFYITDKPELVAALHNWFDAQLLDHGHDAMSGHDHSTMQPK